MATGRKRRFPVARREAVGEWFTCDAHHKRTWLDRKAAKASARRSEIGSGSHMREYRCDVTEGWHVGHLPARVRVGDRVSSEIYGKGRS